MPENEQRPKRGKDRDRCRVLLVAPPVYDVRLHWPKWQVPNQLFIAGTYLSTVDCDVRLIDLLEPHRPRLTRRQITPVAVDDDIAIQKWRFGAAPSEVRAKLAGLITENWIPDWIIVEGFATFWWEGVREAVEALRAAFPKAFVTVTGAYASLAPDHVHEFCQTDCLRFGPLFSKILVPDISFADAAPPTLAFRLPTKTSKVEGLIDGLFAARAKGVMEFSLTVGDLERELPSLNALVDGLQSTKRKLAFDVLGTVSPMDLITVPEAASLLRQAGMRHLCFSDDRDGSLTGDQFVNACAEATAILHKSGFRPRTDAVSAGLTLGRQGEDIAERTRCATLLNHHVGSVIFWPYQPKPGEVMDDRLDMHNGKLFPLRQANGLTYEDYAELIALNAVLNSRYRDCSFDFMGRGLIAQLLASSIAREGWNPDQSVKGPLTLPMRVPS